jgi:hypothetical protein
MAWPTLESPISQIQVTPDDTGFMPILVKICALVFMYWGGKWKYALTERNCRLRYRG